MYLIWYNKDSKGNTLLERGFKHMEKIEMMNKLIENLGVEKALEELVDALSDDEMRSNFEFICRMNDIPMDEEDELK